MRYFSRKCPATLAQEKNRLDSLLVTKGLAEDLRKAQSLILSGSVLIHDREERRAGIKISPTTPIRIRSRIKDYVSRGAYKLLGGLEAFPDFRIRDRVAFDLGASTGGFTQVLLEKGAKKVVAVDVGYGQLAGRLRNDPRVIVLDRFHIKDLTWDKVHGLVPDQEHYLFTMDLSFISLKSIFPILAGLSGENPKAILEGIALVKPQFEIQESEVLEKGILKDRRKALCILSDVCRFLKKQTKAKLLGIADSPITGMDGNREFLIHFAWNL